MNIEAAFRQIAEITPLTLEDEQLFRTAFPKQVLQYAHSWLYVLRAAHINAGEMGYKYVSSELVTVIGYRHNFIYVTPVYDTSGGVKLQQLCDTLFQATARPILIKKFRQAAFDQITPASTLELTDLPTEDDTCPETVLHLQKLFITPEGQINPVAKKLVRRANAFERSGVKLSIIEDITTVPFEKIERFLAHDAEKYASYLPIVRYLYTQKPDPYKYRTMVFMDESEVRGLYMAELFSLNEIGMYGGITSKDVHGITEWMDVCFFKKLFLEGITTIHLGGAENQGIFEYITKLFPHRPAYFAQAILYRKPRQQELAAHIRPVTEADFNALAVLYRDL